MRLLNVESLELAKFEDKAIPNYAIASHRWLGSSEANIRDVETRNVDHDHRPGYEKILGFARYITQNIPTIKWLWIDTCCIDQGNSAELSEAVNLMFEWYRNAVICLAYLVDVHGGDDIDGDNAFGRSQWFKRGWTLQELLAPSTILFLSKDWHVIGNKGGFPKHCEVTDIGPSLERQVSRITGIPESILQDFERSSDLSVSERMKWMDRRSTTREEDMSYALYGIFGVNPGANYGEKHEGARQRLQSAIDYQRSRRAYQSDLIRKIADWLSPADPWANHRAARQRCEPYTGDWLLRSVQYLGWRQGDTRHLWIHGKAGCGKTILCSTAVEDVRRHCERATNSAYAVFYFSFSDLQKQSYEDLLRSLVVQLVTLHSREPGLSELQQAYEATSRGMPRKEELEKILSMTVRSYDEVFMLLDAVDECPEQGDNRQSVLEGLEHLFSLTAPYLRMLVTSREASEIHQSMTVLGADQLQFDSRSVDEDIRRYVSGQLLRDRRLQSLDSSVKTLIGETISEKADGMFQWAYCLVQRLKQLKSTRYKYIKEILRTLPLTLDATYERAFLDIETMYRDEAFTLLRWLAYAQEPPTLCEMAEAVISDSLSEVEADKDETTDLHAPLVILSGLVTTEQDSQDSTDNAKHDVDGVFLSSLPQACSHHASLCNSFATKETRIRLSHFSIKEYLESSRIRQSKADFFHLKSSRDYRYLAQCCVRYLMEYSRSAKKSSTDQDFESFPLLRYAARSWFHHALLAEQSDTENSENILLGSEEFLRDWLLVYRPENSWEKPFQLLEDIGSGIYYASLLGLADAVRCLIASEADVNAYGGYHGTALQAAAQRGCLEIVDILIHSGADVNAQGGRFGNALQAASYRGQAQTVKVLLAAGARMYVPGWHYGTPLQAAAREGHDETVSILLEGGADANLQAGLYGNALQAAASRANLDCMKRLLDAGAAVNIHGGLYKSAWEAASFHGHAEAMKLLKDAGVEASNARDQESLIYMGRMDASENMSRLGRSPLHVSAASGCCDSTCLAAAEGHNVNEVDHQSWTALHWASYFGRTEFVRLLLDMKADYTLRDWQGWAPIHVAAFAGQQAVIQILQSIDQRGMCSDIMPHVGEPIPGYCDCCAHVSHEIHKPLIFEEQYV